ncbi:MAG: hypothetical protein QW502_02625 [Candidatus Bathyarchaeia archaeon]|nr:hypothetical protein [Candidatus Bathyarchaeota archaeon]
MGERRSLVLDTSAFIGGFDPSSVSEETYSVPEVEKELLESFIPKLRFTTSVESGKLKVIEPQQQYINLVKKASEEVGDANLLSSADISILALAAQLKDKGHNPIIITEDYSIQNVAERLKLKFASLTNLGIRYQLFWKQYCPACGKEYQTDREITICENCGTELKRKPVKRKPIKRD